MPFKWHDVLKSKTNKNSLNNSLYGPIDDKKNIIIY